MSLMQRVKSIVSALLMIGACTQSLSAAPERRRARTSLWIVPLAAALLGLSLLIAPGL